jgi:RNA polymerase sigma-70 factor, ECF subfamily
MGANDFLFDNVRKGDKKAFEIIFRENFSHLCAFANTFVKDLDVAQDLVQEIFFHIWQKKDELPGNVPVKAYLFKSIQNRCLNLIKHEQVKGKYQEYALNEYKQNIFEESIPEHDELHEKIRQSIDKLPSGRKKVFIMHRYEELKYKEIAEKLNISVKTVENQIGKALSFLRDELKDYLPTFFLMALGTVIHYIILGRILVTIFS